jgi:hypothetical protein
MRAPIKAAYNSFELRKEERKCSKFFKRCTRSLCSTAANIKRRIVPLDFQSRPEHGKWQAGMNHRHRDCDSDSDFNDPAGWNKAAIARFKAIAGLGSAGGVRFIRPGAGSGADKPAAVQSVSNPSTRHIGPKTPVKRYLALGNPQSGASVRDRSDTFQTG